MIITVDEVVQQTIQDFAKKYPHFKDFQSAEVHSAYWVLCMQALQDRDLLGHIIFCNDLFCIPPMKTFLCYYADDLKSITGTPNAKLDDYIKKSIGAVWGFVFKNIFSYTAQKSASISLNRLFMIKTATYYAKPQKKTDFSLLKMKLPLAGYEKLYYNISYCVTLHYLLCIGAGIVHQQHLSSVCRRSGMADATDSKSLPSTI